MATTRPRRLSKRFVAPARELAAVTAVVQHRSEVFSEGCWPSIRASLEMRGLSPTYIELIHNQLRQGWPLSLAVRQVSMRLGSCPVRSRSLG